MALLWDAKNLLRLFPEESCPAELSSFTRVFGNRKDESSNRQIGDRRGQNFREGRIPGPSKSLPTMTSLLQLCPRRYSELLVGSITDRRDFYHQFQISDEKASLNCIFPKFKLKDFIKSKAYGKFSEKFLVKKKYDRARRGDLLHGSGAQQQYGDDPTVVACFGAIFQGDHLGVELATDAHVNLLGSAGLLLPHSRLRSDYPIAEDRLVDGLVIDDYFSISREPLSLAGREGDSLSVSAFKAAKSVYLREGLIGSDGKDVEGALNYKVCGAEVDSSIQSVRRGVVLAGAPLDKRMSLAVLSAAAASLPYTSDALHACLLGSWISILMMRRQVFAVLNESFKVIPQELLDTENPSLWPLPRAAAEEFLLLACLAPVAASNLAVPFPEALYATDASNEKGGIAEASCGEEVLRALWLAADRKGSSVPIEAGFREALSQYDPLHEVLPTQKDGDPKGLRTVEEVDRPLGLCFEFIEICGGSGVVTKELVKRGIICGPVFDLSFSDAYDLCDLKVLRWFIHMLESDRLRSFLVAPPCTSFSPAAFPSVRSYQQPRGYNQLLDKVRLGNILAFMSLCLLYVALKQKKIGVGEQPRRSKMRWLSEWRRLVALGAVQCVVASCAYGSPHQKEFGLIGVNVILDGIARRCPRNHQHIPIQGKYTKPSAIYCPGLAVAFADLFQRHLKDYEAHLEETRLDVDGLESILCNDVCVGLEWKDTASWNWKRQSHINVLEGKAVLRLLSRVAFRGGDVRLPFLCDSHVARSAIAKGRSPSGALRILLKQISSTCVAYGLYPAGVFAPTRFNPADYPSRGLPMPQPYKNLISRGASPVQLRVLSMKGWRRWTCGWVRLVLLLCPGVLDFLSDFSSSWRRHPNFFYHPGGRIVDFDASLGYPGEGPSPSSSTSSSTSSARFPCLCWLSLAVVFSCPVPCFALSSFTIISCSGFPVVIGAPARWMDGDEERKQARAGVVLHDGRRVTAGTANVRQVLLESFYDWLGTKSIGPDVLIFASPPDLDRLNKILVEYGRHLFDAGKPFYHYSETINAVTVARPLIRRSLQQAWDLAFIWSSYEPSEHHVAMPYQVLIALIGAAWSWGWKREASVFALAWGALLRIGEVLDATRTDLVLPSDVGNSIDYVLLKIREPKTRYRAARHQAGKLEQVDPIEIVKIGFEKLHPEDRLWNLSGSTLRTRLTRRLQVLALPHQTGQIRKPLSLASFRPGGATHLITVSESAELVRRRGRWASFKTMEMYLQEVAASTYLNDVSDVARENVLLTLRNFPELMKQILKFNAYLIPESTWYYLLYPKANCAKKAKVG